MPITAQARTVIERPLDKARIKSRKGGQGMTFDYIGTEYAIQLLNEAFDYAWDSRVFHHESFGDTVVVGVELKAWDAEGNPVIKQQFGSCNVNKGLDVGAAFKGAASDGLKKCASQMGLALELYSDDAPPTSFTPPTKPTSAPSAPPKPSPAATTSPPPASAPPKKPPTSPPPPPADRETTVAPRKGPGSGSPPPPTRENPFVSGNQNTASVPRPAPPSPPPAAPPQSPAQAAASAPPRANPFGGSTTDKGLTSVQMNALQSLASKLSVSQPDLIALAEICDPQGTPKQTFEELTHQEAIQVIKTAQIHR